MQDLTKGLASSDALDDIQVITCILRSARKFYRNEQVINIKCFQNFAKDFTNLTRECGSRNHQERCIYNYAHGIVSDLLWHSPATCQYLFGKDDISFEDVALILSNRYVVSKTSAKQRRYKHPTQVHSSFFINFPKSSCELIARFANEVNLFMRRVDGKDMIQFFVECTAPVGLRLRNPGLFALFMKNMYDANLIGKGWRQVIEVNKLLKTRNGDSFISQGYLNNALSRFSEKKISNERSRLLDAVTGIIDSL
mgnify:CR=1 FL=1